MRYDNVGQFVRLEGLVDLLGTASTRSLMDLVLSQHTVNHRLGAVHPQQTMH